MKLATSVAIAALLMAGSAFAQTATAPKSGTTKISQSDCTAAWNRLDIAKSGSVSQAQAQGVVTDFKAADTNNDGKLTQSEFMAACDKGLVTAASGAASGGRGMTGTDSPAGTTSPGAGGTGAPSGSKK